MSIKYDVAIVGGGIVGLLTSLALAKIGCKIVHIERNKLQVQNDNRSIAVSYSSIAFLNTLCLWDKIASHTQYIKKVHISDKGRFGRAEIFAKDENLPFLGAIAPMKEILVVALQSVTKNNNIKKLFESNIIDLKKEDNNYSLIVENKEKKIFINAELIIACDGANSSIRKMLNVDAKITDYKQDAIVFDINSYLDNENTAYERFMTDGVLAMLPKSKTTMGCVWTLDRVESKAKLDLNKKELENIIQDRFGYRLGEVKISTNPTVFPLYLIQSKQIYKDNVLFFGNALHFLHPVSGQGLNLSIRDIGFLYDIMDNNYLSKKSISNILADFKKVRKPDHDRTIRITNGFVKWFISNDPKLIISRNIGLHLLQRSKLAKKTISRIMMGKLTKSSTLMRKVVENEH